MAETVTLRVKVPSKEILEYSVARWDRVNCPVIAGEFTIPQHGKERQIDLANVSHGITNIRTETYDPNTQSVAIDVRFLGAKRAQAVDEFAVGDIRFVPRVVTEREPGKSPQKRILTWDLIHRPDLSIASGVLDNSRKILRDKENLKDKIEETRKKKR